MSDTKPDPPTAQIECPQCTKLYDAALTACPHCGAVFKSAAPISTLRLEYSPAQFADIQSKHQVFEPSHVALLQILPAGHNEVLRLDKPVMLGRGMPSKQFENAHVLDLTRYDGLQHGVSRQHCLLERQDAQLLLTDLESTNGTYLNGERLTAAEKRVVSDGDRLILGMMHIRVLFRKMEPAPPIDQASK